MSHTWLTLETVGLRTQFWDEKYYKVEIYWQNEVKCKETLGFNRMGPRVKYSLAFSAIFNNTSENEMLGDREKPRSVLRQLLTTGDENEATVDLSENLSG